MIVRPATFFDALDFAGHKAFLRRALVYQVRHSEAFVVERGEQKLALAMFWRARAKRVEFGLSVLPEARGHMLGLCRVAHLTIGRVVQSGSMVFAKVRVGDARAQRMARLVGFVPGRMKNPEIWIFGRCHGNPNRRIDGQISEEGRESAEAGAPAG